MRLVGVIDLMGGVVVRAIGGRREAYRPLVSRLCSTAEPVEVARALLGAGASELYVADLDAIAGAAPAREMFDQLAALGVPLWVDAGVRDVASAMALGKDVTRVVAGLETLPNPAALGRIVDALGGRVVFSLDLRDGVPLGAWGMEAWTAAEVAMGQGVREILILDLARVGVAAGPGAVSLCARLTETHSGVAVSVGGGVRDKNDLNKLQSAGATAALVASALHDGTLSVGERSL